ncbi:SDR family oxidoreductase [Metapseudomonas resinovorans]|uniref:Putative oxidoreductase n=1 Tax=Metapseudomonas resinovorans NBRC 106553 TaxID=1245471 RepID=S6AU01_METRE|nr:SDR family oxidoreductase [Pseudomonas resinovorans]BAN49608.1 putative oxidoreductase [Pseudomonas resinovorans NBRC 106553]
MSEQKHQGVALITGASTGIGATYAKRLAGRGHDLLLVARDQARLEALAAELREQYGVKVEVLKADLTDRADLNRVAQRLRSDTSISALVNNAGVAINGALLDTDLDRFDAMIQLNVVAVTHLAAAAAANFVAQGRGTIINIASVLALAPELFNGTYSGTKAFVLNLSQSLAQEVKDQGVRVQVVLPGATRTEIWERSGTDLDTFPQEMLMEVGEMVDAALAGLDQGELVTIPSLPEKADWDNFTAARFHMAPNLSRSSAAARYKA